MLQKISGKSAMILILCIAAFIFACTGTEPVQQQLTYPETKKVEQVDDYFGTQVADPYRWLEDDNAEDTKDWVTRQNEVTFGYLAQIPYRDKLRDRITELTDYERYSSPYKAGEYYFFYKNDGLQDQSVIYIQKGLDGEPEVFIDPNIVLAILRRNIHGFIAFFYNYITKMLP